MADIKFAFNKLNINTYKYIYFFKSRCSTYLGHCKSWSIIKLQDWLKSYGLAVPGK